MLSFDLPYPSQRVPLLARQAVATSHPLAAQAGLRMLDRGGNAADAAIATAAALTVVEPTMNGLGSDAFALIWDGSRLVGLNASGRSPRAWSLERFAGRRHMPELGWDAVTTPGAVSGWVAIWNRLGSLPFSTLLEPAIEYAERGFHVAPRTADLWQDAPRRYRSFAEFTRVFLRHGRAPRAGDWLTMPDLAQSLSAIAETKGAAFYEGDLARRIAAASRAEGGALTQEDLALHEPRWVSPLDVEYQGVRVHELPPNGQGLATLIALGILRHLPMKDYDRDSADGVHLQIEAMKAAFAQCHRHVADPDAMEVRAERLLDPDWLANMARAIRSNRAARPLAVPPPDRGTVYLTTADKEGRMVSMIQSNYLGFGSGVVVPGTGISMQSRARGFVLNPRHPNCVAGGKLPYHTIMPGFVTRGGEPVMSFGVMGGHMQPQGHVQMMVRTFLHGQNPQAACDAPRWHVTERSLVALERGFGVSVASKLRARGHVLLDAPPMSLFGGAQAIYRLPHGYCAGSDPRKDGQAVGF